MRTDDILQVIPAAAESANMLTGSATVEFATTVPEHAAHGAAATAAGGAHAASMWAPSVAASAGVNQQVAGAGAALAPRGGKVAQRNDQSLTADLQTDNQNAQDLTPVVSI
ncbi:MULTISPECIES: hypothetical protein [Mycobacteriaceae]|jgi:hypothetical protein|nr:MULTISPECIES: hypothetical protein [Mycobacteriaceae]ARV80630.1 hypothetical protein BWK49_04335 [Mycobacterium intracellulare subsp. chimaera]ASL07531.1 hypothetical protein MYCODSM44623_00762 [Mycobacterium intracellulare subsp. chimaera]ASL13198.1 hypothetical protein MYCOZU2_00742 [Mycobacterium intracellulare subsp. chimaera]ASL19337.1 hypothetical protein MYCOZU1_00872 [Mycobacterium intracellulare subsp. chimaera]KKC02451.1 hypothetical protein WU83_24150 [Mycobacterium nebraskense]